MNTPQIVGPGFLAALAAITKYENFSVDIDPEEDGRLQVTIGVEGHEPMVAFGPPGALDAKLPAAIGEYAELVAASRAKNDVVITLPGRKTPTRAKKAHRPTPKKKARVRRKPVIRAAVPSRAKAVPKIPKPHAHAQSSGKPDKAQCIAEYKALKARHGNKLTRRLFVDNAKSGRRYEKLWANSWPTFVKEAEGSKPAAKAAPTTTAKRTPPKSDAKPPKSKTTPKKDEKKKGPWTVKVKDGKGKTLGATVLDKKPGDPFMHSSGSYSVLSVDAAKREIYVESAKPSGAPPATSPTSEPPPPPAAKTEKPGAPYAIKTADGKTHGATVNKLKVGAAWGQGDQWEVVAVDDNKREYTVRSRDAIAAGKVLAKAQAAAPASTQQAWPFATSTTPPKEPA